MANKPFWHYRWFDTPNNEDGLKKAFSLGKIAARAGLCLGLVDAIVFDKSPSNLQKAFKVGSWVFPMVGMSTAFTITQQVSLKAFPTLDEKWSFLFGGVSAAGVMGSWFRSGQVAFTASLLFGGAGFTYQYIREGRLEGKGTRHEEFFTFEPEHAELLAYERRQSSHWLYNNYDWRHQHKERGAEVRNIF